MLITVILSSAFHFQFMALAHLLDLVLVEPLHFFLSLQQLFVSIAVFNVFIFNLLIQLSNFLVLSVLFLKYSGFLVLLCDFNPILQVLNILFEFVKLLFFNEDFILRRH